MTEPEQPEAKPSWLTELQQKSWEPEILLSGIVLYGLFQIPDILDDLVAFARLNIFSHSNDFENLASLLKMPVYWLIFGLILHLVTRGIWVGMVGLSFAFPEGIKKDELKLSSSFKDRIDKIPSIEQIIINLDVLCSSLFSIAFMMFMMIIGGYVFISATLIAASMAIVAYFGFGNVDGIAGFLLPIYFITVLVIALIGLFDFLSLGFLKRFKWLSKIYYPIHRLISFLTLASFYRPIYLTLITNFNKWKIGAVLVLFLVISIFIISSSPRDTSFPGESWSRLSIWSTDRSTASYSGYYDDQNTDMYSVQAHIPSDIISDNTLRLFSVLKVEKENSIKEYCKYDTLIKSDSINYNINLHCASIFHQVLIDDQVIDNVQWLFHYKQKTNQRGILTYIDITDLPKGMHTLKVRGPEEMYSWSFAEIPFYREINPQGYQNTPNPDTKERKKVILK